MRRSYEIMYTRIQPFRRSVGRAVKKFRELPASGRRVPGGEEQVALVAPG